VPAAFGLGAVYPNPSTGSVAVDFALPRAGRPVLVVSDALGRLVWRTDRGALPPGHHSWEWDGRDRRGRAVGSGVYLLRLEYEGRAAAGRVVLVR
jgi:flagellar hook assembly protein FlgD